MIREVTRIRKQADRLKAKDPAAALKLKQEAQSKRAIAQKYLVVLKAKEAKAKKK